MPRVVEDRYRGPTIPLTAAATATKWLHCVTAYVSGAVLRLRIRLVNQTAFYNCASNDIGLTQTLRIDSGVRGARLAGGKPRTPLHDRRQVLRYFRSIRGRRTPTEADPVQLLKLRPGYPEFGQTLSCLETHDILRTYVHIYTLRTRTLLENSESCFHQV